jgi:HTH-type transcriptional regulator/antitoxin HigA
MDDNGEDEMTELATAETDYAVPTGEFIEEWLEENAMSQAELARRLDVSPKHVSKLIAGARLTEAVAMKLQLVTGTPARIWLSYEATYRADVARLGLEAELAAEKDVAALFPVKELRQMEIVTETMRRPGILLMQLMAFFAVGSLEGLKSRAQPLAAFRQDATHPVDSAAVQVWLRLIELELASLDPLENDYDRDAFLALIPNIRSLSLKSPEEYGTELPKMLAEVGIRLLYKNEIKGIRAYGATQWIDGHPVIALTTRGADDGKFWFTLFHEFGHVLHHPHNDLFIQKQDGDGGSALEAEADDFASNVLIPPERAQRLSSLRSLRDIQEFASTIGVCPGIVVGRMHHDGTWPHQNGRRLYKRLRIDDSDE